MTHHAEIGRCEWCGDITKGACGCPAEIEIERLREALQALVLDIQQGVDPADKECQRITGSWGKAHAAITKASASQYPMPADFAKVLHENLWDLYEVDTVERPVMPCPFCGQLPDHTNPDFCYPKTRPDATGRQVWRAGCIECHGGCGAGVSGWSAEEAVRAWNKRA